MSTNMSHLSRLRSYLDAYAGKDMDAIAAMLHEAVLLQDWNLAVQGKVAVLRETAKNFAAAQSLDISIKNAFETPDCAAAELLIIVNGDLRLEVVDVLRFNDDGQIVAIRAYKG
jgi:ketosteroid isomerase-like protein